jgi:predicted DNA binding CopG/RHH family protein
LRSVITSEEALRRYQEYARTTLGKPQRVNIRLSAQTLAGIRSRAAEEGMPYQTLMATVVHKPLSKNKLSGDSPKRHKEP